MSTIKIDSHRYDTSRLDIKNKKNNLINFQDFCFTNVVLDHIIKTANRYDSHMSKFIEISLEDYLKSDLTQNSTDWVYQDISTFIQSIYLFLNSIQNSELTKDKFVLNTLEEAVSAIHSLMTKWFCVKKDKNGEDLEKSRFSKLLISTKKKVNFAI
jgi:hypothetical protein